MRCQKRGDDLFSRVSTLLLISNWAFSLRLFLTVLLLVVITIFNPCLNGVINSMKNHGQKGLNMPKIRSQVSINGKGDIFEY